MQNKMTISVIINFKILLVIYSTTLFSSITSRLDLGIPKTAKNLFNYLEENKYVYENHTIVTEDGYRLLLVRLPGSNNGSSSTSTCSLKSPLLFVHGITASFAAFLIARPGTAFGFSALEEGYDVFLLNTRGSRWSRTHITLDPDTDAKKFWNFSWHEVGVYDLPATINYITNITGCSKVSYVGHSQGGTVYLAMASTLPAYNKKINVAILLAPASYISNSRFILARVLKYHIYFLQQVIEILHIYEVFPYNAVRSRINRLLCSPRSILLPICKTFIDLLGGYSTQTNDVLLSSFFTNTPAGSSSKSFVHFLQNAYSDEFRQFNYGEDGNIIQYGHSSAPVYNLRAITCPTAIFYAANDNFVAAKDTKRLLKNLPNVIKNVNILEPKTNHFDFIMGTKMKSLFVRPALRILDTYSYNNL